MEGRAQGWGREGRREEQLNRQGGGGGGDGTRNGKDTQEGQQGIERVRAGKGVMDSSPGPPLASSVLRMTTAASRAPPCSAAERAAGLPVTSRQSSSDDSACSRASVSFAIAATSSAQRSPTVSASHCLLLSPSLPPSAWPRIQALPCPTDCQKPSATTSGSSPWRMLDGQGGGRD